jgi:hypothetical protein
MLGIRNIPRGTIDAKIPPTIGFFTFAGEKRTVADRSKTKMAEFKSLIKITENSIFGEARNDITQ